jgi:lysophospholipase L1-like esterase
MTSRLSLPFVAIIVALCTPIPAQQRQEPQQQPTEPPFEREIRAFESADAGQMPPRDAILFVGSSSIRMWKTLAKDFPDFTVINRGFGGSTIRDSIGYADRIIIPYTPKRIVLYAGDNDVAQGMTAEQVFSDYKEFVATVRRKLPDVRIDYIAIKPSIKRWSMVDQMREANRLIRDYAKSQKNLGYIDIFTPMLGDDGTPRKDLFIDDGLHLNEKGYELWTQVVGEALRSPDRERHSG